MNARNTNHLPGGGAQVSAEHRSEPASMLDAARLEIMENADDSHRSRIVRLSTIVRFAGEVTRDPTRLTIVLEFEPLAALVEHEIKELFDIACNVHFTPGTSRREAQTTLIIEGDDNVRLIYPELELVTKGGYFVQGLPAGVVAGPITDAEAAWQGAFLVAGSLSGPSRAPLLDIACPGTEVAVALAGFARRLGFVTKVKETRGKQRVQIRDVDSIGAILTRMGAYRSRLRWEAESKEHTVDSPTQRLANFDDANLRRSARAAITSAARVARALEILGDEVADHLAQAGALRLAHKQASLEELGRLADPPITKDAIAGRIRRLLHMADEIAAQIGIPDTHAAVDGQDFEDPDAQG